MRKGKGSVQKKGKAVTRHEEFAAFAMMRAVLLNLLFVSLSFEWKMCRRCEYETLHTHTHGLSLSFILSSLTL